MGWASYVLADEPTNSVSRRLREIVILRVGWLCNSTYEWHQHVRMAKEDTDLVDSDVLAIEVGASDPNWGAEVRVA
jgi:alkylhydroperoxidase family enzyme